MIRLSAALVAVAIGILIGGVVTSRLLLVYVAIGVSAAAFVALAIGAVLKRGELFGEHARSLADVGSAAQGKTALVGQAAGRKPQHGRAGEATGARVPAGAMAHGGYGSAAGTRGARDAGAGQPAFVESGGFGQAPGQAPGYGSSRQPLPRFEPTRTDVPPSPPSPPPPPAPSAGRQAAADLSPGARPVGRDAAPPWNRSPGPGASPRERPPAPPASAGPAPPSAPGGRFTPSWFDRSGHPQRDAADEPTAAPAAAEASKAPERAVAADTDAPVPGGRRQTAKDDTSAKTGATTGTDSAETAGPGSSKRAKSHLSSVRTAGSASAAHNAAAHNAAADNAAADNAAADNAAADNAAADNAAADNAAADNAAADKADTAKADASKADIRAAASGASDTGPGKAATSDALPADDRTPDNAPAGPKHVTVVPGIPRYHTPQCILIRFMDADDLEKMTRPEATEAGLTPCRACQPDSDTD